MRYATLLTLVMIVSLSSAIDVSDCKCHRGFEPREIEGRVKCVGTYVTTTKACNIPERPRCVCSGNVSAILNDIAGTWCLEYARGVELRRWRCENEEEWDQFYQEYPNEKP